jgi:ectoine hydroxylase-related dioxygenase (phytanoyl-CoA dioxygenase family)
LYLKLVVKISDSVGVDFVFEQDPVIRFHLPRKMDDRFRLPSGNLFTLHSDTMLGDYFEQVQAWLPFVDVSGPGALAFVDQNVSAEVLNDYCQSIDYDVKRYANGRDRFFNYMKQNQDVAEQCVAATEPMAVDYGHCLLFCPTVLHGTAENNSERTRISIDFRLLPVDVYDKVMANINSPAEVPVNEDDKAMKRGDYYHALTAQQVKAELAGQ